MYEFGPFRVEVDAKLLLRDGETVPLTPKVFDLLLVLLQNHGQVLSKDTLMAQVWPDTFVEETNLTKGISVLRQTLGEGYIETLSKRGYRFTAPVSAVPPASHKAPVRNYRRAWVTAASLLLAAAAWGTWYASRPKPGAPFQSLAVLPFLNLSNDASQDYFSDGLTEEIINALSRVPDLRVVARTSAFQFRGKTVDIRTVGQQLDAEAILEGSVRIEGDRLRVTAQLNSATDGYHYWSRTWDHQIKDVLAVQREIALEVTQALGQRTSLQPKAHTQNVEAYDLYLRGRYHTGRIGQFPQAAEAFEGALKIDPQFAAAHAQLTRAYVVETNSGRLPLSQSLPRIRENTAKALRLDPDLAMTHATSATIAFIYDWDFPAAERSFRRALELDPDDPDVHHDYAHFLTAMGRFEEAMEHSRQSLELDPLSMGALAHMIWQNYYNGDLQSAVAAAQPALNVDPNNPLTHIYLELTYVEMGEFRKAAAEMTKHPYRPGVAPKALAAFEREGERGYWKVLYDATLAGPSGQPLRTYNAAQDSAQLGLHEESLRWIEKSIANRDPLITYLAVDPPFKEMRSDPRFQELVRRIGLPQAGH